MSTPANGLHLEAEEDGVTHLRLDDGGRNVLTLSTVAALRDQLDALLARSAPPVLILEGNGQALSVGLDTATVLSGGDEGRRLLGLMGEVLNLLYLSRLRSIVACTGHATAAGAMLLLVADHRIGYGSGGKVGLSEVRVGLTVPERTRQLVRDRIATAHQYAATAQARLYDYDGAATVGYLDAVVTDRDTALVQARAEASTLAGLDDDAYLATKLAMREAYAQLA